MRCAPTLRLEPRPSRLKRLALAVLALVLIAAPVLSPWPAGLRLAVAGLAVATLAGIGWRQQRAPRWRWLSWDGQGAWQVDFGEGGRPARLRAAHQAGPLLALDIEVAGRGHRLLLWPDSLPADDLRRLRIRLRREGAGEPDAG
ncbi:MAG: hypothetical protein KF823_11025 [Xanthomonadales bacterium]|nr:hypothetical protein [Xanthomonadales bacterium]